MKSWEIVKIMLKLPFLKKDKNGNTIILFHRNLYHLSVIKNIISGTEGVCLDTSLKRHFQVKIKTKDPKKGLEFCNYLFSEHR